MAKLSSEELDSLLFDKPAIKTKSSSNKLSSEELDDLLGLKPSKPVITKQPKGATGSFDNRSWWEKAVSAGLKPGRELVESFWEGAESKPLSFENIATNVLKTTPVIGGAAQAKAIVSGAGALAQKAGDYFGFDIKPVDVANIAAKRQDESLPYIQREAAGLGSLALGAASPTAQMDFVEQLLTKPKDVIGEGLTTVVRPITGGYQAGARYIDENILPGGMTLESERLPEKFELSPAPITDVTEAVLTALMFKGGGKALKTAGKKIGTPVWNKISETTHTPINIPETPGIKKSTLTVLEDARKLFTENPDMNEYSLKKLGLDNATIKSLLSPEGKLELADMNNRIRNIDYVFKKTTPEFQTELITLFDELSNRKYNNKGELVTDILTRVKQLDSYNELPVSTKELISLELPDMATTLVDLSQKTKAIEGLMEDYAPEIYRPRKSNLKVIAKADKVMKLTEKTEKLQDQISPEYLETLKSFKQKDIELKELKRLEPIIKNANDKMRELNEVIDKVPDSENKKLIVERLEEDVRRLNEIADFEQITSKFIQEEKFDKYVNETLTKFVEKKQSQITNRQNKINEDIIEFNKLYADLLPKPENAYIQLPKLRDIITNQKDFNKYISNININDIPAVEIYPKVKNLNMLKEVSDLFDVTTQTSKLPAKDISTRLDIISKTNKIDRQTIQQLYDITKNPDNYKIIKELENMENIVQGFAEKIESGKKDILLRDPIYGEPVLPKITPEIIEQSGLPRQSFEAQYIDGLMRLTKAVTDSDLNRRLFEANQKYPGLVSRDTAPIQNANKLLSRRMDKLNPDTAAYKYYDGLVKANQKIIDKIMSEMDGQVGPYELVPKSEAFGSLGGHYIPKPIYDAIISKNKSLRSTSKVMNAIMKYQSKWKGAVTIWNIPTHVNNILGNISIADWAGFPIYEPRNLGVFNNSIVSYIKEASKPGSDIVLKRIREAGTELELTTPVADVTNILMDTRNIVNNKAVPPKGIIKGFKDIDKFLTKAYAAEDLVFKRSIVLKKFMERVYEENGGKPGGKGFGVKNSIDMNRAIELLENDFNGKTKSGRTHKELFEEGIQEATTAIMDYSTVSEAVRYARSTPLMPFATFATKFLNLASKTMLKNPERFIRNVMFVEGLHIMSEMVFGENEAEEAMSKSMLSPNTALGRTFIPLGKTPSIDDTYTQTYLDTRYLSGPAQIHDTLSSFNPLDKQFGIGSQPIDIAVAWFGNKDRFTGQEIFDETSGFWSKQGDRLLYAGKKLAPIPRTAMQLLPGQTPSDFRKIADPMEEYTGRTLPPSRLLTRQLYLGIKDVNPTLSLEMKADQIVYPDKEKIDRMIKILNLQKYKKGNPNAETPPPFRSVNKYVTNNGELTTVGRRYIKRSMNAMSETSEEKLRLLNLIEDIPTQSGKPYTSKKVGQLKRSIGETEAKKSHIERRMQELEDM